MIVNVDIQSAVGRLAGIGRYAWALSNYLPEWAGADVVRVQYFDFLSKNPPLTVGKVERKVVRWCPARLMQAAWKTLDWPPYDWLAGKADLYHFPNYVLPPLSRGKSVVSVHDLSALRFPETLEPKNLKYLSAKLRDSVHRADAVITVSAFVASEICDLLAANKQKVFPISQGLVEHMERPDADSVLATRRRLGLDRPYVLIVSTVEPRKNIPFLVRTFERMEGFDGDLVVAGMRGWKYEPILDCMRSSPRADRIRYLEYLNDGDLPGLYAGADLFLFPSLYEGFGLPPLEAMLCGTPVISSSRGSLPEVLGDAAVLLEISSPEEWAQRALRVLDDSELRATLVSKGLERASRYSWRENARRCWSVYRQVASGGRSDGGTS